MRPGNIFGRISVCLSLSVCNALTCESLDLEKSLLVGRCICRIFRSSSYIEVTGSGSRSQEQKACLCMLFAGGLRLTERQCCFSLCFRRMFACKEKSLFYF